MSEPRVRTPRSLFLSVTDQGLSSATNFLAMILAAREFDPEDFGVFSMAYITYLLIVGASQAFISQPLVIATGEMGGLGRRSLRAILVSSFPIAAVMLMVVTLIMRGGGQGVFVVLALSLPVLLGQDVLRAIAFGLDRPGVAVASDAAWLAAFLISYLLISAGTHSLDLWLMMMCWAVGGAVGFVVAYIGCRPLMDVEPGVPEAFRKGYLGHRFFVEFAMTQGASQLSQVLLGGVATPSAVAALRGASTLLGPVGVLISAVPVLMVPTLRRMGTRQRSIALVWLAAALLTAALTLTGVLMAIPESIGTRLLGQTWIFAHPLLLPIGIQYGAIGVSAVGFTALRMLAPRATLRTRVWGSMSELIGFWGGYVLGAVRGCAWGLGVGSSVQAVAVWAVYGARDGGPDAEGVS